MHELKGFKRYMDWKSTNLEEHVEVGRSIKIVVEEISNFKGYRDFDKLT